ncbi:MAG TPA: stalk domain-containing protein [Fimbriimonadaceae bacterium]|nr:stalk domain-containing protein [Fimbriimonadaceae bacterium]
MISSVTRGVIGLTAFLSLSAAVAAQQIQVLVDSNPVQFPDIQPRMIDGRVMVPIRGVFEQMGATVNWDEDTQTVSTMLNGSEVVLHIGSDEATVDGKSVMLDAAPVEIGDRTLVPMRFLGDALGTQVTWNADNEEVAIDTTATISTPPQMLRSVPITEDEVIPVTLDTEITSMNSQPGDSFVATIVADSPEGYANLPKGTRIEGHVAAVEAHDDDLPGIVDLAIDRIEFPDGTTKSIDAAVTSLDNQYAMEGDDGVYHATDDASKYDRMIFAGYNGPEGVLVGTDMGGPITETALRNSLADIQGQLPEDSTMPSDVDLTVGTEMGIRVRSSDTLRL